MFHKKINIPKNSINLSKTNLKKIIELCVEPEQYILVKKYWLLDWKPQAMQKIWNHFNMSRERIRQILNKSLSKVRRFVWNNEYFKSIIEKSHKIIRENWNVMWEKDLIEELSKDKDIDLNYNELLLLLCSDYDLYYIHRNKKFEKLFYISPLFEELLNDINITTYKFLEQKNKSVTVNEAIKKMISIFEKKFTRNESIKEALRNENLYKSIFKISSDIYTFNNKLWLSNNKEVNQKTIRLKVEHVLLEEWKPIHFNKIAEKTRKIFKDNTIKTATIQNELVKRDKFINVWMWIYWLKIWGYRWKTTLEVLSNVLKNANRPMPINEIKKEVLKERKIREVTLIIVLQKHTELFERVSKWVYKLKQ